LFTKFNIKISTKIFLKNILRFIPELMFGLLIPEPSKIYDFFTICEWVHHAILNLYRLIICWQLRWAMRRAKTCAKVIPWWILIQAT